MMDNVHVIIAWIQAHPAECWLALSAVLNLMLRLKSAEKWVEHLEKTRGGAAVISVVRMVGVDPAGAMRALALIASARAAAGATMGHTPQTSTGATMAPPSTTAPVSTTQEPPAP
jgi:hypothetical protein